jgi:hypothetical protein
MFSVRQGLFQENSAIDLITDSPAQGHCFRRFSELIFRYFSIAYNGAPAAGESCPSIAFFRRRRRFAAV